MNTTLLPLLTNLSHSHGYRHPLGLAAVLLIILVLAVPAGLLAAPGTDGNMTVTTADVTLNRYSAVTSISGDVITVSDIDDLDDGGAGHYANENLSAGDMILIYQAQGATFADSQNLPSYGAFNYNNAGRYEFALVASVSGNNITVDDSNSPPYSCGGITNTYDVATGNVQVVRVPQYATLTVSSSGSVIAQDWDGETGGVIALVVQGAAVINGLVDGSGSGFRGGQIDSTHLNPDLIVSHYVEDEAIFGAAKGESILGFTLEYDAEGGAFLRGAPANGGGGGNSHNAGGGGGANGNNGGVWTGRGLPDTSNASWDPAWDLDDGTDDGAGDPLPSYFSGGAGGGRGGYSYAASNQDALVTPPGTGPWNGNFRFNVGGWGGRPLNNDPAVRLFFGGGGGAGEDNNLTGTDGARGGGLVIIVPGSISGSGQILSNGDAAEDIALDYEDGAGGGGAGGTIVIKTATASGVSLDAIGGSGGDNGVIGQPTSYPNESFGPGGGGGGGYIAVNSTSGTLTADVSGGPNGQSASEALLEFPPNGATGGYDGGTSTAAFALPGCIQPTAITLLNTTVAAQLSGWLFVIILPMLLATAYLLKKRLTAVN